MDFNNALAIYSSAFDSASKEAQKALASVNAESLFTDIATASKTAEGLYEYLQAPLTRSTALMSIYDIVESAPLDMQQSLQEKSVSRILADKHNGLFVKFPLMVELPRVVKFPDESFMLISGNHRVGVICAAMLRAGLTEDAIAEQQIEVEIVSVNKVAFLARLGDVKLTDEQYNNAATDTLMRLWHSANASRIVAATEANQFNKFKHGTPKTVVGITNAVIDGTLTLKEAFTYASNEVASDCNPPIQESLLGSVFPQDVYVKGYESNLTVNTVRTILASTWAKTAGSKVYSKAIKASGMVAVVKMLEAVFTVSDSLFTDCVVEVQGGSDVNTLTTEKVNCTLLQAAIDTALSADGVKDSANIARNASAVGVALAELLKETELMVNYAVISASPTPKASPVKSTMYKF